MKRIMMAVALVAAGVSVVAAGNGRGVEFEDDFNDMERYERVWELLAEESAGQVEHVMDDAGNGMIEIESGSRTAQGVKHKLKGLTPGTLYRISARVRTDSVAEGRGAVLFVNPKGGMEQPWNASRFVYGTTDWQAVYMDFVSDVDGEAEIALALGFPWGGTSNGGKARGRVWWDDVMVGLTPDDAMKMCSGKHIRVAFDADKVEMDAREMKQWVKTLDKVYECYGRLVGDVPFGGRRIDVIATPGIEAGYWALAGNPILINSSSEIGEIPAKFNADGDWSFGVTHEMGHVFNAGNMGQSCQWNWDDELFANFRMSYALEKLNGRVSQDRIYEGRDIMSYYKKSYDRTIGEGKVPDGGDAIHYTLLRIKERYGWDVFEKAFRELYALGDKDIDWRVSAYDKFLFFMKHVSDAAGEDVMQTTYSADELALIERGLK